MCESSSYPFSKTILIYWLVWERSSTASARTQLTCIQRLTCIQNRELYTINDVCICAWRTPVECMPDTCDQKHCKYTWVDFEKVKRVTKHEIYSKKTNVWYDKGFDPVPSEGCEKSSLAVNNFFFHSVYHLCRMHLCDISGILRGFCSAEELF